MESRCRVGTSHRESARRPNSKSRWEEFAKPPDFRASSMSKIFEALKRAELARADEQNATAAGTSAAERPERRRRARGKSQFPPFASAPTPEAAPSYKDARTIASKPPAGL